MRAYRWLGRALGVTLLVASLTGCTIQVPTESVPGTTRSQESSSGLNEKSGDATAPPPPPSSSAELPPQTVAQIRQKDMSFKRGAYLKPSAMLTFSDGLMDSPEWEPTQMMVNGESVYRSTSGCEASLRSTNVQDPLVVEVDDRASTRALFRFQDPSILGEHLEPTQWLWGESPDEAKAAIEFLTYVQPATETSRASAVSMRLFAATRTGIVFTASCETDDQLSSAVADIRNRVSVVPPDN
ncbi:hypothetical protein [Arthrobacter roseus]|uniref:hypothetical protein n=1 Tax=Arthrobacter roseus TaxID=136274 RepID=UPI001963F3E0|nr:hypothetical protein [Arthrobacter roseus]MBM7849132.1 hypothetical protein [Arthrobacter roseus]